MILNALIRNWKKFKLYSKEDSY